MNQMKAARFDTAAAGICKKIRSSLLALSPEQKLQAQEIRLRAGRPVAVCFPHGTCFLRENGETVLDGIADGLLRASKSDIEETFQILCENSVYSHENEIRNGYLTLRGGYRAGICGTAVLQNGEITGIRDISSICLRIARELPGCADELLERLGDSVCGGLLIAGPPSSGKTTILRDIVRQLSSGIRGPAKKVVIVDERGEIAGCCHGIPQNDVGLCCDVLDGYPKAEGILMAVRSLSPQIVVCDEIGSETETRAVELSLNAGAAVIASIHAGNLSEFLRRDQATALMKSGAFQHIAMLRGCAEPGKISGIYRTGDLVAEICRGTSSDNCRLSGRVCGIA